MSISPSEATKIKTALYGKDNLSQQQVFAERECKDPKQDRHALGDGSFVGTSGNARPRNCCPERPAFNDDDLRQVIALSELDGQRPSERTILIVEKTSVTDAGVRELGRCRQLEFLALPSIALSDEAVEAIGH